MSEKLQGLLEKIKTEGLDKAEVEKQKILEDAKKEAQKIIDKANSDAESTLKKAEEADRLKSAFLANMSHEIRTPMNAIIGFSSLLNDPELAEDSREELISHIEHNSNTLLHLIDDIIDIAKMEAGQLEINKKECNVNKVLNELYKTFSEKKNLYSEKNIELLLKLSIKNKDFIIYTDTIRIQQVLTNLIDNAIKYTEKGSIEFGYTIEKNSKNSNVIFFVKDTGIGLPQDQQKNIFTRFTKIETNRKKLYRGAGLGLAICKNIVNLLDGEIWVESEANKGSTFYFSLPLTELPDDYTDLDIEEPKVTYNWRNKTILVAEDEESNFDILEFLLKKTKAKVIRAENGKEAIDIFNKNKKIDLILMDIKMPKMDGLEATKHIRKNDSLVPIIAQTAYAMANDEKISLKAGCNDYIPKPIKKSVFYEILNKYLG